MNVYSCSPARRLPALGHDHVLLLERPQRPLQVDALLVLDAGKRALPEGLADHRGVLQDASLRGRERVEPGGEHGVDRLREGLDVLRALLADPVDHLLGEQGVARRALGDLRDEVGLAVARAVAVGSRAATSSRVSSWVSGSSAIVVALRRPPPQPGRRSSSSSRARQTIRAGPRTQRARYSIRSSIPSSAQWMSSIAITTGQRCEAASTSERTAENRRSRICCGSSASWTPVDRRVLGRGLDAERAGDASRRSARRLVGLVVGDRPTRPRAGASPRPARSRRCRRSRTGRG